MRNFFKKLFILISIPVIIYAALVVYFEPLNYFGLKSFDSKAYMQSNPILKLRYFNRNDCGNIILGESRSESIDMEYIEQKYGVRYINLSFSGSKTKEMVDMFWYANSQKKLENVIFQISYYGLDGNSKDEGRKTSNTDMQNIIENNEFFRVALFKNRYKDGNRVVNTLCQVLNPICYLTDSDTINSVNNQIKSLFIKEEAPEDIRTRQQKLDEYSQIIKRAGENYSTSEYLLESLIEIADYCSENNINLTFVMPPMHVTIYENVIDVLNLQDEIDYYKSVLIQHANVYDMEFLSEFSYSEDYVNDGFHFTGEAFLKYMDIIFGDEDDESYVIKYFLK